MTDNCRVPLQSCDGRATVGIVDEYIGALGEGHAPAIRTIRHAHPVLAAHGE